MPLQIVAQSYQSANIGNNKVFFFKEEEEEEEEEENEEEKCERNMYITFKNATNIGIAPQSIHCCTGGFLSVDSSRLKALNEITC
jgi:hypothetical protein